mmetsp:Transcript_51195/g.147783  ORF Transcript_51195/g.147783 Transcript_51195/m.147783 type:complete len:109 (-) Transcript_51195:294-620(-)
MPSQLNGRILDPRYEQLATRVGLMDTRCPPSLLRERTLKPNGELGKVIKETFLVTRKKTLKKQCASKARLNGSRMRGKAEKWMTPIIFYFLAKPSKNQKSPFHMWLGV